MVTDANHDVMALTDASSGAVMQWFGYGAYGTQYVFNSSYASTTDGFNWQVGFQGGMTDPLTGLVHFNARDYDPVTGRWMEPDPMGVNYVDGPNLYQAFDSNPPTLEDPTGLAVSWTPSAPSKSWDPKNPHVILPGGGQGTISIGEVDITPVGGGHRGAENDVMSVGVTGAGCSSCHWLQLYRTDIYDAKTLPITGVQTDLSGQGLYTFGSGWTVDANPKGAAEPGGSFYTGKRNEDNNQATIFDNSSTKYRPGDKGIEKVVFSFYDVLVCNNTVSYIVQWTKTLTPSTFRNGWHSDYDVNVDPKFTGPSVHLAPFATGSTLPSLPVTTPGGNTPILPHGYPNPIKHD